MARSLWNDNFTIEIHTFTGSLKYKEQNVIKKEYEGSLKGALRYVLKDVRMEHGHASVSIYDSQGEWLKEIMF